MVAKKKPPPSDIKVTAYTTKPNYKPPVPKPAAPVTSTRPK